MEPLLYVPFPDVVAHCVFTPWIAWGLLPFVFVNVGFWGTAFPLEFILRCVIASEETNKKKGKKGRSGWSYWFRTVDYSDTVTRGEALRNCRERFSFKEQVCGFAISLATYHLHSGCIFFVLN